MADLIDRTALLKKLNAFYGVEAGKNLSGHAIAALSAIDEANAVDAEPVRYGEWQFDIDEYYGDNFIRCSLCGEEYAFEADGWRSYNYCPHCGAKMDLKEVQHAD